MNNEKREQQMMDTAETYAESVGYKDENDLCSMLNMFCAGWRAADNSRWIPVEERLPQTIDWYLCYNDLEDGCEVLHWEGDGNVWMDNDWHYKSKEITHWMPIVLPRKEATNDLQSM